MKTSTLAAEGRHRGFGGKGAPAFDFSSILRSIPTLKQVRPTEKKRKISAKSVATSSAGQYRRRNSLKALAEAIILQSIEDLWSKTHRKESLEFFTGEGFRQCADMAGMSVVERLRIMRMLRKVNSEAFTPRHTQKLSRMANPL